MSGADFSSSNDAEFQVEELGNTQQNRVRVQRAQWLDRQAERTAALTPAFSALLLLLLLPPSRLLLLTSCFFLKE